MRNNQQPAPKIRFRYRSQARRGSLRQEFARSAIFSMGSGEVSGAKSPKFLGLLFDANLEICQSIHVVNVRVVRRGVGGEAVAFLHVVEVVGALELAPNVNHVAVFAGFHRFFQIVYFLKGLLLHDVGIPLGGGAEGGA